MDRLLPRERRSQSFVWTPDSSRLHRRMRWKQCWNYIHLAPSPEVDDCKSHELRGCKLQELKRFKSQQERISNTIKELDARLTSLGSNPSNFNEVQAAIALRQFLQNQKNEAVPPVGINAFYLGSTMLLWPAFYALVGWLVFIFPPRLGKDALQQLTYKKVFLLSLYIFIFYRWPTWWRNTPLGEEGRKFYGNNNFDIDRIGFFVQETLGAGVALLVAVLWLQWSAYYTQVRIQLSARAAREPVEEALKPELAEDLSMMFLHWQIASALIALSFFWYTIFFWQTVMVGNDMRYLPHAIIVHSMWFMSWIIVSLPLVITAYEWHRVRSRAAIALSRMDRTPSHDAPLVVDAMEKLEPIGYWNIAASAIAVAASFAIPILRISFGETRGRLQTHR